MTNIEPSRQASTESIREPIIERSGSIVLVDQLLAEGVRYVFASPGLFTSPLLDTLAGSDRIERILVESEALAGGMALGYSQASGRAAVLGLSSAAGLINGLSTMYAAQRCRIPLIVLVDEPEREIRDDGDSFAGNLSELARPLAKWTCELRSPGEIARNIRRAFHEALSAPRGPVFLSASADLLRGAASSRAIRPPQSSPLGAANSSFCAKAARALVAAKRPCVIAGNEVSLYRARKETVCLVEVLGCAAFSEPLPTGVNFPNRHPQFSGILPLDVGRCGAMLRGFDTILALGMQTRPAARGGLEPFCSEGASVIQINVEAALSGRAIPCDLSASADIAESLSALRAEIQLVAASDWLQAARHRSMLTIAQIEGERRKSGESTPYPGPDAAVSLLWFLRLLDAARPPRSTIVSDLFCRQAGDDLPSQGAEAQGMRSRNVVHPCEILTVEGSADFFSSNAGVSGYAASAALGVQLANPGGVVVCLTESESAQSVPVSLWAAARARLPVKFVIVHGASVWKRSALLAAEKRPAGLPNQDSTLSGLPLCLSAIEAATLFQSSNLPAESPETLSSLERSLQKMFRTPGPFLLNVYLDVLADASGP